MSILIFSLIAALVFSLLYNRRYSKIFKELNSEAVVYLEENYQEEMYLEEKTVSGWFNSFSEPYIYYAHPVDNADLWFKVTYEDGEFTDNYFNKYLQKGAGAIIDSVVSKHSSNYRCFASGSIKDEFGFYEYYQENGEMLGYDKIEYIGIDEVQISIYDYEDNRNAEPYLGEILSDIKDLNILEDGIAMIRIYVHDTKDFNEYTAYFYYYDNGEITPGSKYTAKE